MENKGKPDIASRLSTFACTFKNGVVYPLAAFIMSPAHNLSNLHSIIQLKAS